MDKLLSTLQKICLFKDKTTQELETLFEGLHIFVSTYPSGKEIISDGEPASRMGIILAGKVEAQKLFPSGKTVTIARFGEYESIAEAAIFASPNVHHANIVATEESDILFIPREHLLTLFARDSSLAAKLLEIFANRIILLNRKIELLSLESTRQKIAHFLLKEMKIQQSREHIILPFSKKVLAEHMNITRPSLSRELGKMCEEEWISMSGRRITILNLNALENVLLFIPQQKTHQ